MADAAWHMLHGWYTCQSMGAISNVGFSTVMRLLALGRIASVRHKLSFDYVFLSLGEIMYSSCESTKCTSMSRILSITKVIANNIKGEQHAQQ